MGESCCQGLGSGETAPLGDNPLFLDCLSCGLARRRWVAYRGQQIDVDRFATVVKRSGGMFYVWRAMFPRASFFDIRRGPYTGFQCCFTDAAS